MGNTGEPTKEPLLARVLLMVLAAPWLGHGRASECFLALVCAGYGTSLLVNPGMASDIPATVDIAWTGNVRIFALPYIIKALLTGSGLALNIYGSACSRQLRFLGGLVGLLIWTWWASKLYLIDAIGLGFFFYVMAGIFSVRIMGLALANLPRPGAPGVL